MDVKAFLRRATSEQIADRIARLASRDNHSSIEQLRQFLLVRAGDTFEKATIPRLACRALINKGPKGIEAMVTAIPEAPMSIYPTAIIEALWYTAQGKHAPKATLVEPYLSHAKDTELSPETIAAANEAVQDLVLESHVNYRVFLHLMTFLWQDAAISSLNGPTEARSARTVLFDVLAESAIKVTRHLINQLDKLTAENHPEEVYQKFLAEHPVFLDPLASRVIPKQSLGIEYVTDFVLRRLDNEYVIVEIEKPQNRIFTRSDNFTAQFTHAFGQIIDFQEWIDAHGEYARTLMPGISAPRGLLVIGRRADLTQEQAIKLRRYCLNSQFVQVFTFDDLVAKARDLYQNIHAAKETA